MNIIESNELIGENEVMLTTDKGEDFFTSYCISKENILTDTFTGWYTEPDYNEVLIDVELIECYKSNEDLENLDEATQEQKEIITEYLSIIYQ